MASQRALMDREFKNIAERNETFLNILPTITRAELAALILKNPKTWGPYAAFMRTLSETEGA